MASWIICYLLVVEVVVGRGGGLGKQRRYIMANQCAKKVVSSSTGLLDFLLG